MEKWLQKTFPGPVLIDSRSRYYNQFPTSEDTNEESELIPNLQEVSLKLHS
jgi:hypothetical protein